MAVDARIILVSFNEHEWIRKGKIITIPYQLVVLTLREKTKEKCRNRENYLMAESVCLLVYAA